STMNWPITPASVPASDRSSMEHIALPEGEADVQVDTEPRAQSSTQITGPDDSILEWADERGRQRRRQRRIAILIALAAAAVIGLGAGAIYAWMSTQP
ncbi:MAG TPA: hypothetical protein VFE62_23140, partial [Gemmataceae bacterium]|nr:hypothetical protein [Gemmataceae bacterium]